MTANAPAEPLPRRASPAQAVRLASQMWERGERIDIGAIARQLGVGRATLFRWVGSKELLIGEVAWSYFSVTLAKARAKHDDLGLVCEEAMRRVLGFMPLKRFLEHDPEYALRVLTSKSSTVQARTVATLQSWIEDERNAGRIAPTLSDHDCAYVLVRVVEGFLYADLICAEKPRIAPAVAAIRALLGLGPAPQRKPSKQESAVWERLV